jgi:hypothetical protein
MEQAETSLDNAARERLEIEAALDRLQTHEETLAVMASRVAGAVSAMERLRALIERGTLSDEEKKAAIRGFVSGVTVFTIGTGRSKDWHAEVLLTLGQTDESALATSGRS